MRFLGICWCLCYKSKTRRGKRDEERNKRNLATCLNKGEVIRVTNYCLISYFLDD